MDNLNQVLNWKDVDILNKHFIVDWGKNQFEFHRLTQSVDT